MEPAATNGNNAPELNPPKRSPILPRLAAGVFFVQRSDNIADTCLG
jgi:hypothetical protein